MSETMSNLSSDWAQFYQPSLSVSREEAQTTPALFFTSNELSNTTTVTTTTIRRSSSGLIQEGRVLKPIRKRSRMSRRTPTTLFNTDTTNFRAMVQQFTAGPVAPFASVGSYPTGPNIMSFRSSGATVNPHSVLVPLAGYNIVQLQQQQQFCQHQYMNRSDSVGNNPAYLCGIESPREPVMLVPGGVSDQEASFSSNPPSSNQDMSQFDYM